MADRKQQIIEAFHKTLIDFGYSDLTLESTEKAIVKVINDNHEGDVIAVFIHGWLNGEYKRLLPECKELFKK